MTNYLELTKDDQKKNNELKQIQHSNNALVCHEALQIQVGAFPDMPLGQ